MLAILIAMQMRWCNAGRITQWSTPRASLEATGCHHQWVLASHCRGGRHSQWFWSKTQNTNKNLFLASYPKVDQSWKLSYPILDPLVSSSMQQASFKCEMPWLELKSLRTFLAIKCCQLTEIGKVIKLVRSLLKSWAHICARRGKAVKGFSN